MGLRALLRGAFAHYGYVLGKREYLRFGMDPFLDVSRLSHEWSREIATVFDVGANDGGTLRLALPVFPQARFFSFEPHPATFSRLRASVQRPRVSLHQLCFGETHGEVTFYEYGADGAGSLINSLVPNARLAVRDGHRSTPIRVLSSTLDTFCVEHQVARIDLLKLDVEGAELSVLRGAHGLLSERRIDFVYAEFNDLRPRAGTTGGSLIELADLLEPFGFRYIATYTDYIKPKGDLFIVANVLFARTPEPI